MSHLVFVILYLAVPEQLERTFLTHVEPVDFAHVADENRFVTVNFLWLLLRFFRLGPVGRQVLWVYIHRQSVTSQR